MTALNHDDATTLARSLSDLLRATQQSLPTPGSSALTAHIVDHIGCSMGDVPNVTTNFAAWELANLQRGLDAYLAAQSPQATPPNQQVSMDEAALQAALDELSGERQALTRSLLGAADSRDREEPGREIGLVRPDRLPPPRW